MSVALALLAMLIELCIGYPERLTRAIGHPVTWIGGLIDDRPRSQPRSAATGRAAHGGIIAVVVLLGVVGTVAFVVQRQLLRLPSDGRHARCLASTLIAQRSLHRHVADVASALDKGDIAASRAGSIAHCRPRYRGTRPRRRGPRGDRKPGREFLGRGGRAGFVAAIAGLPGVALYKAINTADSMIGHRTPRHAAFGWAAARLDDLVNLPASRLAALLLIAAAALRKDAAAGEAWHRSGAMRRAIARPMPAIRKPQWPAHSACRSPDRESMAAFASRMRSMGGGRRDADAKDIRRALALYRGADAILVALVAVLAAIFIALA